MNLYRLTHYVKKNGKTTSTIGYIIADFPNSLRSLYSKTIEEAIINYNETKLLFDNNLDTRMKDRDVTTEVVLKGDPSMYKENYPELFI